MNTKPILLDNNYIAEFDQLDKPTWHNLISDFSDANIYQTWSYDEIRCGKDNISHFVLRKDGIPVAAAQARIVRIPIFGLGAAYIRWAPLWQRRNHSVDFEALRMALRALRNEYVCRRRLILRIFPILFDNNIGSYNDILSQEGFVPVSEENRARTLIMDIAQPLEQIRKKFDQKWRNCLNKSERNNIEVIEGTSEELFINFIGIYRALLDRKRFQEPNDINEFRKIQLDLPTEIKMRIFLGQSNGVSSAGVICAAVGDTGVYLFGATNDEGMSNKGSYLLQWKAIQWLKNIGCSYYNLNGINPEKNPGGYHFKAGLSGKSGQDLFYLGRFDCYPGEMTAKFARMAHSNLPRIKATLNKLSIKL